MAKERRGRGFPLFAVLLIALGVVLLLQTTGVLPWQLWGDIWRWWPVLIIALGINIAFGGRMTWLAGALVAIALIAAVAVGLVVFSNQSDFGIETVQTLREPLRDVQRVDVTIGLGAGDLVVSALSPDSLSLVEGELRGWGAEADTAVIRSNGRAELRLSTGGSGFDFFGGNQHRWDVRLSPLPRASIDVDAGASGLLLDLRDMNVSDVSIDGGAADIEILAPMDAGHVNIDIDVGAASIVVIIPDHVGARIDADAGIADLDIDEARFPRTGDVYLSRDFETSADRIDLEIDAGASQHRDTVVSELTLLAGQSGE